MLFTTSRVLVHWDDIAVDQIGPVALDAPGDISGETLARFGNEIPPTAKHVESHPLVSRRAAGLRELPRGGIEILTVPLEGELEGHVVNAGAEVIDVLDRYAEPAGQIRGGALHAVTETDHRDARGALDRPDQHRHRI